MNVDAPEAVPTGAVAFFDLTTPIGWSFVCAFAFLVGEHPIEPFGSLLLDPFAAKVFASGFRFPLSRSTTGPGARGSLRVRQALAASGSIGSFSNRAVFRIG